MVTSYQQIDAPKSVKIIQKVAWCELVAAHLGDYLTSNQLDNVYNQWALGCLDLWAVIVDGSHEGTIATCFDAMLDDTSQLVMAHCGGDWIRHKDVVEPFFVGVAKQAGCAAIRAHFENPRLARIFKKRWQFKPFETTVLRPLERGQYGQ
jgi:hypothetical protein